MYTLPHRHCEQNPNQAFASCDVPQELSDREIDQEIESDEVSTCGACLNSSVRRPVESESAHLHLLLLQLKRLRTDWSLEQKITGILPKSSVLSCKACTFDSGGCNGS